MSRAPTAPRVSAVLLVLTMVVGTGAFVAGPAGAAPASDDRTPPTSGVPARSDVTTTLASSAMSSPDGNADPAIAAPRSDDARRAAAQDRRSGAGWRGLVGWTVGGFALVVGLLAAAGVSLGVWAWWVSRRPPVHDHVSPNHPAVRSRQRAERIAAARRAAEAPVVTDGAQQS